MKHLFLLILVALSTACGGAEFSGVDPIGAGGDDTSAGTGGVTVTGGAGAGGTAQGGKPPVAGSSAGGSSAGSASGGAPPATCEFDPAMLAAALPSTFVWEKFEFTSGDSCSRCQQSPCEMFEFTSWGVPTLNDDGTYTFLPNTAQPMVELSFGANDGTCAEQKVCGAKSGEPRAKFSVAQTVGGWMISEVAFEMEFGTNQCIAQAAAGASPLYEMGKALGRDFAASLEGLVLPCPGAR